MPNVKSNSSGLPKWIASNDLGDHAPVEPNRESAEQIGDRHRQIAVGNRSCRSNPRTGYLRRPSVSECVPYCITHSVTGASWQRNHARELITHRYSISSSDLRCFGPLHPLDDDVHPSQTDGDQDGEEHPAGRPETCRLQQVSEDDRTDEPAESAEHTHDASHDAHIGRKIVRDVLVDGRLADPHDGTKNQAQRGEDPDIGLEEDFGNAAGEQLLFLDFIARLHGCLLP